MKKVLTLITLITTFMIPLDASAQNVIPADAGLKPVEGSASFAKSYKTSSENLLYLLLSALNELNYSIEEIQFKTGSVLFKAYKKEFIASVASQDGYNSFIKIIPTDNIYNFSPLLIQRLHTYIENNNGVNFQKIL